MSDILCVDEVLCTLLCKMPVSDLLDIFEKRGSLLESHFYYFGVHGLSIEYALRNPQMISMLCQYHQLIPLTTFSEFLDCYDTTHGLSKQPLHYITRRWTVTCDIDKVINQCCMRPDVIHYFLDNFSQEMDLDVCLLVSYDVKLVLKCLEVLDITYYGMDELIPDIVREASRRGYDTDQCRNDKETLQHITYDLMIGLGRWDELIPDIVREASRRGYDTDQYRNDKEILQHITYDLMIGLGWWDEVRAILHQVDVGDFDIYECAIQAHNFDLAFNLDSVPEDILTALGVTDAERYAAITERYSKEIATYLEKSQRKID